MQLVPVALVQPVPAEQALVLASPRKSPLLQCCSRKSSRWMDLCAQSNHPSQEQLVPVGLGLAGCGAEAGDRGLLVMG